MRNVVFLVKNGIGFGHIRRALLLAEALQTRTNLRPIVISQARSLTLYHSTRVRVVNFPLLHRVPSAVTEDCYLELLDEVLARIDPVVVVEDTYPDARYGALSALRDVPRMLVMRRLDGLSFDQLRERQAFARYDELLIAQPPHEFAAEGHSGDSLAAVESSARVRLVGNIHHAPADEAIAAARHRYAPDGRPLVVVNGGAGGDQMPDGYGDRLFGGCAEVARRLAAEGHPAQFVLVTGPYYAGRPLTDTSNTTVRGFDPELAALLAAADVAVIKPGNNVLSETLLGAARLVLVPDVSFMEGLDAHAARTVDHYGGVVVPPTVQSLDEAIRTALHNPPRQRHTTQDDSGIRAVIDAIRVQAEAVELRIRPKQVLLIVRSLAGTRVVAPLGTDTADWPQLQGMNDLGARGPASREVLIDGEPPYDRSPQDLADAGVRMLINPGERPSPAAQRWLRIAPSTPSLLVLNAMVITPRAPDIAGSARRLGQLLDRKPVTAVLLDLRRLADPDGFVQTLLRWIVTQPVNVVGPSVLAADQTDQLLGITS